MEKYLEQRLILGETWTRGGREKSGTEMAGVGAFWGTRVMEIVKKHDSGGLLWKRIKLTTTRKANAKKRLRRVWQVLTETLTSKAEVDAVKAGTHFALSENALFLQNEAVLKGMCSTTAFTSFRAWQGHFVDGSMESFIFQMNKKDSSETRHKDEVVLFRIEIKMGLDGNMGTEPPKDKLKSLCRAED
ncbi:hypothetical protein Patl1_16996 [Pistacia atlantica]|uniref:Uncharacterized protein n=1 Tax=Pistacia atlantica TaxID=434234 RepID=A0ACC1B696_9ROSI|nr:hypothetical protein Patl1_16996 [Pistacia atlantica]